MPVTSPPRHALALPTLLWLAAMLGLLSGCAGMVSSAAGQLAGDLSLAILDQDDPQTVREGAPAYLLLVDGLIRKNPDDAQLLMTAARLYVAYAAAFVADPERAQRLTARGRDYAARALCLERAALCATLSGRSEDFTEATRSLSRQQVPVLYTWASASAAWIQARPDDWAALAELPKVQTAMERVVELDETYDDGGAHVYLGVLYALRPAALGGQTEQSRAHFERAIALSGGRNLMAKVQFARHYARLVFDQELHDRLLQEVLAADPSDPGRTLINTLAQEQARQLLASSSEYF